MPSTHRPEAVDPDEEMRTDEVDAPTSQPPLSMKGAFGTAVGSAMLGFEQALRNQPPAEVVVAQHTPDRHPVNGRDDLVIRFPEPPGDP
jgi:hypothetical protein